MLKKRSHTRRPFNRKRFFKILAVLVVIILIAAILFILKTNPFQIKQVRFLTPSFCVSNQEIESIISPKSQNFLTQNFTKLETKVVEKYPCLKSVSIKKVFPNTLEISTVPRQKEAIINVYFTNLDRQFKMLEATSSSQAAAPIDLSPNTIQATESGSFVADADNVVFAASVSDLGLPMINLFDQNISVGQKLDDDLVSKSLVITQSLQGLGLPYKTINIKDSSVYVDSQPSITLSLAKDLNRQLITLQLILQKAKIESNQVQKVDLRFDKAVVVYTVKRNS